MQNENKKIVNGYNLEDYTVDVCFDCKGEQVIHSKGVSKCIWCDSAIFPCSVCEKCDYKTCPIGCNGTEDDFKIKPTRRVLKQEELDLLEEVKKYRGK